MTRTTLHRHAWREQRRGIRAQVTVSANQVHQGRAITQRARHQLPHLGVRLAERHSARNQPLRNVGGHCGRSIGCALHGIDMERCRRNHVGDGLQTTIHLIKRVEQRFFVFLKIAVVRQGQTLQRGQQAGEIADHSTRFSACEFGDVGILFLRQHRGSRCVLVAEGGETKLLGGPQHPLLTHSRQVQSDHGERKDGFRDEVTVTHCIK